MKKIILLLLLILSADLVSQEKELQLFSKTKLELSNVFQGKLGEKVKGKGKWLMENGILSGVPTEGQKHAPVAHISHAFADGIIQYEVRMDDAENSQMMFDDAKRDHKMRLVLFSNGRVLIIAGSNKNKTLKNAGKTKSVQPLNKTDWYRVTLEFKGANAAVHINGNLVFNKKVNDDFAASKSIIAFTMKGKASFRNVKYWSGS